MSTPTQHPPGQRRRAIVRRIIGAPGSIRRWLLATLLGLILAIASLNLYAVMAVAVASTAWLLVARSIVVGDEDEMGAWVRWQHSRRNPDRYVPGADADEPSDPDTWFNRRSDTFLDAPPPPVLEDAGPPAGEGAPTPAAPRDHTF